MGSEQKSAQQNNQRSDLRSLLDKKRDGFSLTKTEIEDFIQSLTSPQPPPDYQVSALLAFIFCRGLSAEELLNLTVAMKNSGKAFDYSGFPSEAFFIDKHSSGGVGDKISIPLVPILLACSESIYIPMIAGRGLGHTGGTIDKLESIPGFRCNFQQTEFLKILKSERACINGQTSDIAPADRVLYALRDVTGTVPSLDLIVASILSKKLSESLDAIIFDVKFGSGAFMKDFSEAEALASKLVEISKLHGVQAEALLTNMNTPTGRFAGNLLEIKESMELLKAEGPEDTLALTCKLAERMLVLSGMPAETAQTKIKEAIESGRAYEKFERLIEAQGGDLKKLEEKLQFPNIKTKEITASQPGFLALDVYQMGMALIELGAGRKQKMDVLDLNVGFEFFKKHGEPVDKNECLLKIYYSDDAKLQACEAKLSQAIQYQEAPLAKSDLIRKLMLSA